MADMTLTLEVSFEEARSLLMNLETMRKDAAFMATTPRMNDAERSMYKAEPGPWCMAPRIEAIKMVRNRLGCSLKAAKDIVELG